MTYLIQRPQLDIRDVVALEHHSKGNETMKACTLLLLCASTVLPAAARADVYQYVGTIGAAPAKFTFDTTGLILTPTTVTPISCTIGDFLGGPTTTPCDSITLNPFYGYQGLEDSSGNPIESGDIEFYENGVNVDGDSIPPSTFFTTPGVNKYLTLDTLTITDLSTVTPEPSSLLLLGTGVLSLTGALRRRRAARS